MKQFAKNVNLKPSKEAKIAFLLLMLLAAVLRFYGFSSWSLSNDELSALNRLNYDSLSDLIRLGIAPDGHPAFVQIFLYFWTGVFGTSTFALRLPFVLAGIGTCFYAYFFMRDFIHEKAAQLFLALLSSLQLFILYSQIARPYAMGLFFIMASSYYWQQVLQKKASKLNLSLFVFFSWAGIISHYFASLCLGIILLSGLFFLNRENGKRYILSLLLIGLLFLPHLGLSLNHLSIGGVAWVPAPTEDFLTRFLVYSFNESKAALYCFFSLPVLFLLLRRIQFTPLRLWILPLVFGISYHIGLYYSMHYSPVLQFSVLIFSLPFFLALPISMVKTTTPWWIIHVLSVLLVLGGLTTLFGQSHLYSSKPFANYKAVAHHTETYLSEYESGGLLHFSNSSNPAYFDYYHDRSGKNMRYDIAQFDQATRIAEARDLIESSTGETVMLSFANVPIPAEVYEYTKAKFPIPLARHRYFNSEVVVFGRGTDPRTELNSNCLKGNLVDWAYDVNQLDTLRFLSANYSHYISPETPYALTFENKLADLISEENPYLSISANVYCKTAAKAKMVFSLENDSASVFWRGVDLQTFQTKEDWFEVRYVYSWDKSYSKNQKLKVYFWNPDQIEFWVDEVCIRNYSETNYAYYEIE